MVWQSHHYVFSGRTQPTNVDDIYYWPVTFTSDFGEYIVAFGNVRELKGDRTEEHT